MTVAIPRGYRFVSGTITGENGVRHNVRSLSRTGVLRNSKRRPIRVSSGVYDVRIRMVRGGRPVTRRYTLNVSS